MIQKIQKSLSLKLIFFSSLAAVLVTLTLTLYFYTQGRKQLEEQFGWALEHIATTAAVNIDGELHANIRQSGDENKKEFIQIRDYLKKIRAVNDLTHDTIYTFQKPSIGSSTRILHFAVMLHERPFVGDPYRIPEAIQILVQKAMKGESAFTRLYKDDHGEWISAYAPIFNKKRQIRGILAVDYKADKYVIELKERSLGLLLVGAVTLLISIITGYYQARNISRPILQLNQFAQRVMREDFSFQIKTKRQDELGNFIMRFQDMANFLQERFVMLKYVSPYTRKMITRLRRGELSEEGQEINVTILFSDLRGYTSYSDTHTPQEVISTMNLLLGVQTEIISKHDGYVDKFVGDEIIAYFEGEHQVHNAIMSAIKMVNKVEELGVKKRKDSNETLHIGIGISKGDIILGSLGSKDRKDFTAIGIDVSLASRLCSIAKPVEILFSSNVYKAAKNTKTLPKNLSLKFKEKLQVKGFNEKIHIYYVDGNSPSTKEDKTS